jgi:phosphoglycolate phosphatase-like HAD superfamily hydrolase
MDGTGAAKAEVLGRALAQLDPIPDRVVMVGDRAHDVEGAAWHGIATVVVGWGYGSSDFAGGPDDGPDDGGAAIAAVPAAHVATVEELREVFGV